MPGAEFAGEKDHLPHGSISGSHLFGQEAGQNGVFVALPCELYTAGAGAEYQFFVDWK